MHSTDVDSLRRMLGSETIPDVVRDEYELRERMFHRNGGQGPLQAMALIELLRFLGFASPKTAPRVEEFDWRTVPHDGSIAVSVKDKGVGQFVGMVSGGVLAVRFPGNPWIQEFPRTDVRLATSADERPLLNAAEADTDLEPNAELLLNGGAASAVGEVFTSDEVHTPFSLDTLESGSEVWLDVAGEVFGGTFVKRQYGKVLVRLTDEEVPREFPEAAVVAAEK